MTFELFWFGSRRRDVLTFDIDDFYFFLVGYVRFKGVLQQIVFLTVEFDTALRKKIYLNVLLRK